MNIVHFIQLFFHYYQRLTKKFASSHFHIPLMVFLGLTPMAVMAVNTNLRSNTSPKIDLSSPYATVQTHFMLLSPGSKFLRHEHYLFKNRKVYSEESKNVAEKLKTLLTLHSVNITNIPAQSDYIDITVNEHRYVLSKKLPMVYLTKEGNDWRYSEETFLFISQYQEAFKLDKWFYQFLPKSFCQQQFLDILAWQYLTFLGLIIAIWLLYKLIPYFFKYLFFRLIQVPENKQVNIEKILFVLIVVWITKGILPLMHLQLGTLEFVMHRILGAATSLLLIYLSYSCVGIIQNRIKQGNPKSNFTVHMLPIFSMLAKIIFIFLGLITTVDNFGIDTGSLVQVLSFSTLGLTLALQDTVKNLFGSLMIVTNRPFEIGDDISSGGIRGKVEDIGLRATLLRTREGSLVYIPNAKFADTPIDNFGKRNFRMIQLEVLIQYNTLLEVVSKFVRGIRGITKRQSLVIQEKTELHLDKMSEDGFIINLRLYLDTTETRVERKCRHSIIMLILQMANYLELRLGKVKYITQIKEAADIEEQFVTKAEIEKILEEVSKEGDGEE